MANTNDDMDRKGNRINTPQGSTLNKPGTGGTFQGTPQGRSGSTPSSDPIERDREMNREQGFNLTNQDDQFRGSELHGRDSGKSTAATSRESETRGSASDREDRDTTE